MEVSEVLNKAADLLEKPGAWTQMAFARNAEGEETGLSQYRGQAVCWCILGATWAVAGDDSRDADDELRRFIGDDINCWNDAPGRTQAEVVEALRQAALRAAATQEAGRG